MGRIEQTQEATAAAEARFDAVFDRAPIGMALLALDGSCQRANEALCALLGVQECELVGRGFQDVTHPDDVATGRRRGERLLLGDLTESVRSLRLLDADGDLIYVQERVTLIRDADREPVHFLVQFEDVSARRQLEFRIQELAERDPLTGLPNRPVFERELAGRVGRHRRRAEPAALLLLDLDHFKYVNDAHGHSVGDELLLRVVARVRAALPPGALLARLGGDELAVLVEGEAPEAIAERLVAAARTARLEVGGDVLHATASVGVAPMGGSDEPAEAVLVAADLAMYEAKAAGGDRFAIHDPATRGRERASIDLRTGQRLRAALEHDGFELHAQPVFDARTGKPVAYELLVRLRDETGALLAPRAFLPGAERFGFVSGIDRWVAARAVELIARHDVPLCVNLSGRSVGDPALPDFLEETVRCAGIEPSRLILEVTETAAIANMDHAQRLAVRLRALGCRFALDDFGAGFASFTYVKQLPFDILKIDGSFVRELATNHEDRVVVRALVDVARGLGKQTVAEFVGDPIALALVRECGVDLVQGFHLGAPAPLEAWLGG